MWSTVHNQELILLNYLPSSDVILNMSWFSTKLFVINCASGLSNLSILDQSVCFWSFVLEAIISFYLSIRLIRWFLNPMPLHSHSFLFWLSIDTHIRSFVAHQVRCWIVIRQCPSHLITLWVLLIHNAFVKLYPLLGQPCSAFGLVLFTLETCGICF